MALQKLYCFLGTASIWDNIPSQNCIIASWDNWRLYSQSKILNPRDDMSLE